jgi:hypothetical protein
VKLTSDTRITWVALGVEIAADRRCTWGCLAGVSQRSRKVVVELKDPLMGTDAAGEIERLWARHDLQAIALDPRSPSSTLIDPLQAQCMPLRLADTIAVTTAHGRFMDLLNGGRMAVRGHRALDEAVRVAEERRLAGAVALDRYVPPVEQAPLLSAELACWGMGDPDEAEGAQPNVWVI